MYGKEMLLSNTHSGEMVSELAKLNGDQDNKKRVERETTKEQTARQLKTTKYINK